MSPWDGLNRRKFPRIVYPCLVVIRGKTEGEDRILTHTENIGIGGVGIIVKKHLKMFSPVDVELDLMDFSEHLKCHGKVVWSVRRKSSDDTKPLFYDIGIEFEDISEEDLARLKVVVDRIAKHHRKAL